MMVLNRQEKEKLVLDLYYNRGKNYREIAKEARISPRDIGLILNKAIEGGKREGQEQQNNDDAEKKDQQQQQKQEQEQQLSLSTQAYKLFSKGKTPIEVAVALNARESEITRFCKEYCKLNQMHDLNIVYEELRGNITPFLKLYRSARVAGMNEQHVVNLLRIANNDNDNLPAVEHRYERLKQEVNSLEIRKLNSNRNLQDLKNQILTLRKTLDSCNLTYRQQAEKITQLQAKKIALEDLVKRFENNNEEYLKINQTVKDKVSSILSDGKVLLRLALYSLIESIRNEPVKYSSLIYNNNLYSSTTTADYSSQYYDASYGRQHDYFMEAQIAMLVQEAEKLYNKLGKDLTNRIIDTAFNNNGSTS